MMNKRKIMLFHLRIWLAAAVLASAIGTLNGQQRATISNAPNAVVSSSSQEEVKVTDVQSATSVSVTEYGAKGDCSANRPTTNCTDNSTAIQRAINHCYMAKCAVYFPANPKTTTQTVYYSSEGINPLGVAMVGPPGASGPADYYTSSMLVAVRGAPGKDVFDVPDPATTPKWQAPLLSPSVRDLAILVDNTVDASSSGANSFPNRLPGRTIYDAECRAGNSTVTSNTALFQPGDVNQAFEIDGCGAGGAKLTTAIATWVSPTQVTLATAASTSQTAKHAYISVNGLSATQTAGNCGYAYDAKDFTYKGQMPTSMLFENMIINTINNNQTNSTCGFFFQGSIAPYMGRWEHDVIQGVFPILGVPANAVAPKPSGWTGWGDFNVIDHSWIIGQNSILVYDGSEGTIRDTQFANTAYGPAILQAYGVTSTSYQQRPNKWHLDLPEIEASGACPNGGASALRLSGQQHTIDRLSIQYCSTGKNSLQLDTSYTSIKTLSFNGTLGDFNINGDDNQINAPGAAVGWKPNVTGTGNVVITQRVGNPLDGLQPARPQYANNSSSSVGPAELSRGAIAFNRTHDFIEKGASGYYLNDEDLWLWPHEVGGTEGHVPTVVTDSKSVTGNAIRFASGSRTSLTLFESNGVEWKIGSQIPKAPMRIYFAANAGSSSTTFHVDALYGTGVTPTTPLGCNTTLMPGTSYAVGYCDADATSLADGDSFGIRLGDGSTLSTDVNFEWIAIRPWTRDLPTQSLQVGSGAAMTGNQGNGSLIMHSTGGARQGDLVSFDSHGNAVDSGVRASQGGEERNGADPAIPGDLLCAHAGDTTIHSVSINGPSRCNGTTCTLTGQIIPADYAIPNQLIGVIGTSGATGLNGGPYVITSYSPNSVTFNYNAASGTPSGGAFYRWCENRSKDATTLTEFSKTEIIVPSNGLVVHTNYQHRAQMLLTTTATAPIFSVQMKYGVSSLYRARVNASPDQMNNPSQLTVNVLPLATTSSGVIESSLQSFTLSGSNSNFGDLDSGIQIVNTTADQAIQMNAAFSATGIRSITSGSGGTINGVGTCTLSSFNGGGADAIASVKFTTPGNWNDAVIVVNNTGYGYTATPTTAALSSGTASCSGTATLTTVLGGAQGNAVELIGLQ